MSKEKYNYFPVFLITLHNSYNMLLLLFFNIIKVILFLRFFYY